MLTGKRLAKALANAAYHKLAFDIELLDVKKYCSYSSFFLILSGKNKLHLAALSDVLDETLRDKGARAIAVEGTPDSGWIIMDVGDIIVHIFHPEMRSYYNLFSLWGDSPSVELTFTKLPPPAPGKAVKKRKKKTDN